MQTSDSLPTVGYVFAVVGGEDTNRCMLDNSSTMDVISNPFLSKLDLETWTSEQPWKVRLAD